MFPDPVNTPGGRIGLGWGGFAAAPPQGLSVVPHLAGAAEAPVTLWAVLGAQGSSRTFPGSFAAVKLPPVPPQILNPGWNNSCPRADKRHPSRGAAPAGAGGDFWARLTISLPFSALQAAVKDG